MRVRKYINALLSSILSKYRARIFGVNVPLSFILLSAQLSNAMIMLPKYVLSVNNGSIITVLGLLSLYEL